MAGSKYILRIDPDNGDAIVGKSRVTHDPARGKVFVGGPNDIEVTEGDFSSADVGAYSGSDVPLTRWDGNAVVAVSDDRFVLRVEADKFEIERDGVDAASVTLTVLQSDGVTVATNVNGVQTIAASDGRGARTFKITFTAGVATVSLTTARFEGGLAVESTNLYRVEDPTIEFVAVDTL